MGKILSDKFIFYRSKPMETARKIEALRKSKTEEVNYKLKELKSIEKQKTKSEYDKIRIKILFEQTQKWLSN